MKRHTIRPRPHWQDSLERMGFDYHSVDGNYWQENAYYAFDDRQIDVLERATAELHAMYLSVVGDIVKQGDYEYLGIGKDLAVLIERSFLAGERGVYGRFDLSYDGVAEPKLLEYNADTPTALFEASVAQWYWLKERRELSGFDQFNSIHEQLILTWRNIKKHRTAKQLSTLIYFTAFKQLSEDFVTCRYLQDTAMQAGLDTLFLDIADIGYDGKNFVDLKNAPIECLFKLYPWEWLIDEPFGQYLADTSLTWLEPAWKVLLSNKALLCLLWQKFQGHPNLLPCYFSPSLLGDKYVKKPFFSREGANIELINHTYQEKTGGDYGAEGYVYQALKPLPKFINNQGQEVFAVIGSWVIEHTPAGIGIREDTSLITKDSSLFVPHIFGA